MPRSPAVSSSRPALLDYFRGAVADLKHRPPGNVPALDVLRSLAILLVFSGHIAGEFHASHRISRIPLFYWGWTGVDLFFVLSGLLIGTQLWKEVQLTGTVRIGTFLLRRGLRIWPLYFSFVALLYLEVLFLGRRFSGLLADTFFLSNYFHCQIGGGWSLSTEEQFYIVAPVCIWLAARLKFRRLGWLPVLGLLVPIVIRILYRIFSSLSPAALKQYFYSPIHTHSDALAIGVLFAWLAVYRADLIRSSRFRLVASTVMFLVGAVLYVTSQLLFNFTALALVFGAATFFSMGLNPSPRILNWHGFYLISRLSYGVYLNHFGLLPKMHDLLGTWGDGGGVGFWIAYLLSFCASMAIAFVTFQLIEWPFLKLRSQWMKTRRSERILKATPMHEKLAT